MSARLTRIFWLVGTTFAVAYLSEEELEKRIDPTISNPAFNFYWQMMLQNLRTDRLSYERANMNETFPHIKPMKVEEFVKTWWGEKESA